MVLEPGKDVGGMSTNVKMVENRLGKTLDDAWEEERDEWHIESLRAYDAIKSRERKWVNEMHS